MMSKRRDDLETNDTACLWLEITPNNGKLFLAHLKGHSELLPYKCVHRAACVVCQHSKTNIQSSSSIKLLDKTTVLKFHMEHDLSPWSQNCKFG